MYPTYLFKTAKGVGKLICLDGIEPNNGRMLYKISLLINEVDVTSHYFENINNINFYLRDYVAVSPDENWVYIPKEGDHFLIDTHTLQKVSLPYLAFSAATFKKNFFYQHFLIIVSSEEVIIKNLQNGKVKKINVPHQKVYFEDVRIANENTLHLYLSTDTISEFQLDTLR